MTIQEDILSNLRLAKMYLNDVISELELKTNYNAALTKEDLQISENLYKLAIETKNQIIYGDCLPF